VEKASPPTNLYPFDFFTYLLTSQSSKVWNMANFFYDQLRNPNSDGRPSLVEGKIASEHVMQVACASYDASVPPLLVRMVMLDS
jgi:hypothetical protein